METWMKKEAENALPVNPAWIEANLDNPRFRIDEVSDMKHLLGYSRVRVYDGSRTEWGSMVGVPIAHETIKESN